MTIYKVDDGYVISSYQVWRPGCYESERAAKYAFRFDDDSLRKLQNKKNPRCITFEDLQQLKRSQNGVFKRGS